MKEQKETSSRTPSTCFSFSSLEPTRTTHGQTVLNNTSCSQEYAGFHCSYLPVLLCNSLDVDITQSFIFYNTHCFIPAITDPHIYYYYTFKFSRTSLTVECNTNNNTRTIISGSAYFLTWETAKAGRYAKTIHLAGINVVSIFVEIIKITNRIRLKMLYIFLIFN